MARKVFAFLVTISFLYISSPLLFPIAMGAIFAVLFAPLLEQMRKRSIGMGLGSALLTLGITLGFLLPTVLLVFQVARTGVTQLQAWKNGVAASTGAPWDEALISHPGVSAVIESLTGWLPLAPDEVSSTLRDLVHGLGVKLADLLGDLLSQLPGMALGLAVIMVSLYFFLVDGQKLLHFVRRNSIFNVQETDQLIATLAGMCRSVVLASVLSGLAQSLFFILACLIAGETNLMLIGTLVFMGSFIPIVGSFPVTFTVVLHQFLSGATANGIGLAVAALLVTAMDNFIRPWFLKGSANLHPLVAFVAAFGGLQTLGFVGIFLGPIIAALFIATVQILVKSTRAPKLS